MFDADFPHSQWHYQVVLGGPRHHAGCSREVTGDYVVLTHYNKMSYVDSGTVPSSAIQKRSVSFQTQLDSLGTPLGSVRCLLRTAEIAAGPANSIYENGYVNIGHKFPVASCGDTLDVHVLNLQSGCSMTVTFELHLMYGSNPTRDVIQRSTTSWTIPGTISVTGTVQTSFRG